MRPLLKTSLLPNSSLFVSTIVCAICLSKKNDIDAQAYGTNEDKFSLTFSMSNVIISVKTSIALLGTDS